MVDANIVVGGAVIVVVVSIVVAGGTLIVSLKTGKLELTPEAKKLVARVKEVITKVVENVVQTCTSIAEALGPKKAMAVQQAAGSQGGGAGEDFGFRVERSGVVRAQDGGVGDQRTVLNMESLQAAARAQVQSQSEEENNQSSGAGFALKVNIGNLNSKEAMQKMKTCFVRSLNEAGIQASASQPGETQSQEPMAQEEAPQNGTNQQSQNATVLQRIKSLEEQTAKTSSDIAQLREEMRERDNRLCQELREMFKEMSAISGERTRETVRATVEELLSSVPSTIQQGDNTATDADNNGGQSSVSEADHTPGADPLSTQTPSTEQQQGIAAAVVNGEQSLAGEAEQRTSANAQSPYTPPLDSPREKFVRNNSGFILVEKPIKEPTGNEDKSRDDERVCSMEVGKDTGRPKRTNLPS